MNQTAEPIEKTETAALLEKLEQAAHTQQDCARRQSRLAAIAAAACVGIFLLVGILFVQLQPAVARLNTAAENLSRVSADLAEIDFEATVSGMNDAMTSAQQSLAQLEQIDIDTLNAAINDLADVVTPLARLLGR